MNISQSITDMAKILLIEDDELLSSSLKKFLQGRGHTVECVMDGKEGLGRLKFHQYDSAILDWNLPGLSGPELLRQFRSSGGTCPVLMLTSNSETVQKIAGLDAGADDYLTKPFDLNELNSRLQALLRRPANLFPTSIKLGLLEVDVARKSVSKNGISIRMLPKEFAVLEFLLRHPDQFFDVNALLEHVWSSESDTGEAAVWQVIKRLRAKLDEPDTDSIIVSVKGMGYKIDRARLSENGNGR